MSVRALLIVAALVLAAGVAWLLFRDSPRQVPGTAGPETLGKDTGRGDRAASGPGPTRPARPRIRPRSVAEGEEPEAAEPAPITGSVLVTVVGADGGPIARAGVAPCAKDDNAFSGWRTDAVPTGPDGTARVGIGDASTHLVVTASGYPPALVAIENRERMRVVLGGEVTLRGKVLVNGAPPAAPLMLTLRGYDDPTEAWPAHPRRVAQRQGFGEMRIRFETGAGGEFSVRGPAPGTSAAIEIPEGYRFADSSGSAPRRELPVICNGEPVVLHLVSLKAITARLVPPPEIQVAKFTVRYSLALPGGPPRSGRVDSDERGQVAVYFDEAFVEGVEIEAWWANAVRYGGTQLHERIADSRDLGDVVLALLPPTTFHVGDAVGRPLAGGLVFADGHLSPPTDAGGITRLALPPRTSAVIAGAPGFKLARAPLPESVPSTFAIRLERSVTLVVRVRHEDTAVDVSQLLFVLAFDVDASVLPSTARHEFNDVRGSFPLGVRGSGVHQTRTYAVVRNEDVQVSGFEPGQPVELRVEDVYQHELLRESIKLGSDDVHPVELVVRSKPRTIRGTVLDHEGRPLAGAQVGVTEFWKTRGAPRTDESGNFDLDGIFVPSPTLAISAPGHVDRTVIADTQDPLTIRLERARQLAVTLIGGDLSYVDASVTFETGDAIFLSGARGDRTRWFEAIPRRAGTLRVTRAGGKTTTTPIGADETRVSVPAPE